LTAEHRVDMQSKERSRRDFTVDDRTKDLLAHVAWSQDVADSAAMRLAEVPRGYMKVWDWADAATGGLLAVLYIFVLVRVALGQVTWLLLSFVIGILVLWLVWFLGPYRLRNKRRLASWDDRRICHRLLTALDAANAACASDSWESRLRLARAIEAAAFRFYDSHRIDGVAGSWVRKEVRGEVERCAAALWSFHDAALTGDAAALALVRDDLARALLRVEAGHWPQVAQLQTDAPDLPVGVLEAPRLIWPLLRRLATSMLKVLPPIIALITALAKIIG
jgi:hypothetical protein